MRKSSFAAVLLAALSVASGAAAQNRQVYVASTFTTDQPAKAGEASSEAAAMARAMEVFVAEYLAAAYPCAPSPMTESDAGLLVDHERQLQLLGQDTDPARLANIGKIIGAPYMVNITVTVHGGSATINTAMLNMRTRQAASRQMTTFPLDRNGTDAMQAFAKKFVDGLGSRRPAAPKTTC